MRIFLLFIFVILTNVARTEDGYELWLRYKPVASAEKARTYRGLIQSFFVAEQTETTTIASKELQKGLSGLLGKTITQSASPEASIILARFSSPVIKAFQLKQDLNTVQSGGYLITTQAYKGNKVIVIASHEDVGLLYGAFHLLRLIQTESDIENLDIYSSPKTKVRILSHWDNLDRTVERGYAGFSLWDWHKLPDIIDPRYHDYARANASIGINGTVLTNVNANAQILTPLYLKKVKALADVFRPYGIKVYLTARFSAPVEIGKLETADPLDKDVRGWWKTKIDEIYRYVPDFGGFVVKANSEGQPGPQNYNRTHADGANMLAEALQPHNGIVMWRAFVYDNEVPVDRVKQAYDEFKPLDGQFLPNVMVQVKNGPLDFQPREPFHPLFGAMPKTPLIMEFQITQEYLGFATHLVYLDPLFEEVLDSDTWVKGKGSTVAKVIDGTLHNHALTGMAGVANIGNDRNWTGHPFGQANWYAFGRLACNPDLGSEAIADEWIRMTWGNDPEVVSTVKKMMMASREITVKYMTPLGLHHIMGWNHHYGPAPWIKDKQRADWTSVYYHRADSAGIGFNRTKSGSNALEQYHPKVAKQFEDPQKTPEKFLLWFHHLGWDTKLKSGRTLWEALCYEYYEGADSVKWMQQQWQTLENEIDDDRFAYVKDLLALQAKEARWWRNACVLYFQSLSGRPIPRELEKPEKSLEYYQSLEFPFAPGIKPQW